MGRPLRHDARKRVSRDNETYANPGKIRNAKPRGRRCVCGMAASTFPTKADFDTHLDICPEANA